MTSFLFPEIEGELSINGSLCLSGDSKKWLSYWFHVKEGLLIYSHKSSTSKKKSKDELTFTDRIIDIVPLTYCVLEEPRRKKDKPTNTPFGFVLTASNNKRWRTVFRTEGQRELDNWKRIMHENIMLAKVSVFDTTITDACMKANCRVPTVMQDTIKYIYTGNNLEVEGLFRVPGDKSLIEYYKDLYDKGFCPKFEKVDPHLVCGILKLYLREVTDSLIPNQFYKNFMTTQTVDQIKEIVDQFPETNRCCISYLMNFLGEVEKQKHKNLMDVSNLATVFGPTVIRNNDDSSKLHLEETAQANLLIKMMIENRNIIFSQSDLDHSLQPLVDETSFKISDQRICTTAPERAAIESIITSLQVTKHDLNESIWDNAICYLVNSKNSKSAELESRIFVSDINRFYIFFRGGKLEYQTHFLDIIEIDSPSKSQLTLTWNITTTDSQGKPVPSGKTNSVTVCPISYASFDMDSILSWIHKNCEQNFIGKPEKIKINIESPERKKSLLVEPKIEDESGCCGLVQTYKTVCNWMNFPVLEDVIWDLENYFYPNSVREFKLYDIIPRDKWPCPELLSIMFALRDNLWFKTLDCSECVLGNDSILIIADTLKHNKTIQILLLKDASASNKVIATLCEAFAENKDLSLRELNLSGNSMDNKTVSVLSETIPEHLGSLTSLDISNAKISKMAPIFDAFLRCPTLLSGLVRLNISQNKLDSSASKYLGSFLSAVSSLEYLNMSATSPSWGNIIDEMTDKTGDKPVIIKNKSILSLDISHNFTKAKNQSEVLQFLLNLPKIQILAAAEVSLTPDSLLTTSRCLTELDISDNDMSDDSILAFLETLYTCTLPLKKLSMNRMFKYRSKLRQLIMQTLAQAITKVSIAEFYINNCKLKADIQDFICGLFNNKSLEVLDVSYNSSDTIAQTLAKMLQHNQNLHTIHWDGNDTTVSGLKSIYLGLQRNNSIRYMPLPLLDIADILKKENVDTELVVRLTTKIQHEISLRSLHPTITSTDLDVHLETSRSGVQRTISTNQIERMMIDRSEKPTPTKKNERRFEQKAGKKRKKQTSIDINRAALVFGSVSTTKTSDYSESETASLPNADDLSVEHSQKEDTKKPSEEVLTDTDISIPECNDTDRASERVLIISLKNTNNEEKPSGKKSPSRSSSVTRQHIGKRVKKKTQRNRLISAPSVGSIPTEKNNLNVEYDTEDISTSNSARKE